MVRVSASQPRFEVQCLIEIRFRMPEILFRKPHHAAIEPGFGKVRVERKRAV
jgi:hypothetical protein